MFDDVVTIFNQLKKNGSIIWYAHVLENVELQIGCAINQQNKGEQSADKASLHIPMEAFKGKYAGPKEWKKSEDKESRITICEGDFFVKGELEFTIINDDDYPSGFFDFVKSEYDDVYNITSIGRYKAIPHFEVGGN